MIENLYILMGSKKSTILNSQNTQVVNTLEYVEFTITPPVNLNLNSFKKNPQGQVIRFSYSFADKPILHKEKGSIFGNGYAESKIKKKQSVGYKSDCFVLQQMIGCREKWSTINNCQSLLLEYNDADEFEGQQNFRPNEVQISTINLQAMKGAKDIEYRANEIYVSITIDNLDKLQSQQNKQSRIVHEEVYSQEESEQQGQLKGHQQNLYLKILAFAYKSYTTRSILKQLVKQLYSKGVREYAIVLPDEIKQQDLNIKRVFLRKVVEVFYEFNLGMLLQNDSKPQKPRKPESQFSTLFGKSSASQPNKNIKVYLIWEDLMATDLINQIKTLESKINLTTQ